MIVNNGIVRILLFVPKSSKNGHIGNKPYGFMGYPLVLRPETLKYL